MLVTKHINWKAIFQVLMRRLFQLVQWMLILQRALDSGHFTIHFFLKCLFLGVIYSNSSPKSTDFIQWMLSTQDPKAWTWTRHIACAWGPHSLVVERDKAKHKHRKMHQSGSGDQLIINVKSRQGPGPRIIRLFHVQKAIWEINYSWKKKKNFCTYPRS